MPDWLLVAGAFAQYYSTIQKYLINVFIIFGIYIHILPFCRFIYLCSTVAKEYKCSPKEFIQFYQACFMHGFTRRLYTAARHL